MAGRGGGRKEGAGKAAREPGVSIEAKTELGVAVYLWHSGEAELGTGLFIFHTFSSKFFSEILRNPSDKFPRAQKNPWSPGTQPSLWGGGGNVWGEGRDMRRGRGWWRHEVTGGCGCLWPAHPSFLACRSGMCWGVQEQPARFGLIETKMKTFKHRTNSPGCQGPPHTQMWNLYAQSRTSRI